MRLRAPDDDWHQRTHILRPEQRPKPKGEDCLVIIYAGRSEMLGKRYVLQAAQGPCTLGRGADNVVVLETESCSRRHARVEPRGGAWWVVDQDSTNGTFVNDEPVREVCLHRGDHIKIGDTILKYLAGTDVEAEFIETISNLMVTDGLTQANNRRFLSEQLEKELGRARRHNRPLSLILFDLDHFKQINDRFGHIAGDYVLRECARVVRTNLPELAVFARYGGEEFAVLLPETHGQVAFTLAERLRLAIAGHGFQFDGQSIPVTVSMGVSVATTATQSIDEFIQAADEKLYVAKRSGRNRVVAD